LETWSAQADPTGLNTMVAQFAAARRVWMVLCGLALVLAGLPARGEALNPPNHQPRTFIFHLNGVGGRRVVDRWLIDGLKEGGVDFECEYYDWTHGEEGMVALQAYEKNRQEAKVIARLIEKEYRARPGQRFIITSHSGGTGLAAWALEDLPDDVKIDSLFMFAPALSPGYDLSKALTHVKGHCYVFSSLLDQVVLNLGTRVFGTIDGVKCASAGFGGFVMPKEADQDQYKKLISQPYQESWLIKFGNAGSHICAMRPKFAKEYIAPIILTGKIPPMDLVKATTRPAASAQAKASTPKPAKTAAQ
jgi:hypothetical protein